MHLMLLNMHTVLHVVGMHVHTPCAIVYVLSRSHCNTVQREIFKGENFRGSVGKEHFAEKTFAEC